MMLKIKIISLILLLVCLCGYCSADLVNIIAPKEKAEVQMRDVVEGSYNSSNTDSKVFVLIWPIEVGGPWWVQPIVAQFSDNTWRVKAYFGGDSTQDSGTSYKVIALLTNEALISGQTYSEDDFNMIKRSASANSSVVTVIRA